MRAIAILLAAGEGSRIGGPKALLRIGGETFFERLGRELQRPGVTLVVGMLGCEARRVVETIRLPPGVLPLENERWREGMLSSVLRGLDAAEAAGADAVLLHPVDHPLLEPATVDRVLGALAAGATIVVPTCMGRRGHPGGFAKAAWPALRASAPEQGARGVLAAHPEWVVHVAGDPGCVTGIDTPADYARWIGSPPA